MKQSGKLSNERGMSPLKKQRTQKPSRDSPETREEAEETYYSRSDFESDNFYFLFVYF